MLQQRAAHQTLKWSCNSDLPNPIVSNGASNPRIRSVPNCSRLPSWLFVLWSGNVPQILRLRPWLERIPGQGRSPGDWSYGPTTLRAKIVARVQIRATLAARSGPVFRTSSTFLTLRRRAIERSDRGWPIFVRPIPARLNGPVEVGENYSYNREADQDPPSGAFYVMETSD